MHEKIKDNEVSYMDITIESEYESEMEKRTKKLKETAVKPISLNINWNKIHKWIDNPIWIILAFISGFAYGLLLKMLVI